MVQLHKFVRDQLVKGRLQSKLENSYKSLFIWKRQFCIVLMVWLAEAEVDCELCNEQTTGFRVVSSSKWEEKKITLKKDYKF